MLNIRLVEFQVQFIASFELKEFRILMAGARGIEPRSTVLETVILAVVLCPYDINIVTDS